MVVSAGSLIGNRSPAIDRTPFSFRHGVSPKVKPGPPPFPPPLPPASLFRSESRLLRCARNDRGEGSDGSGFLGRSGVRVETQNKERDVRDGALGVQHVAIG